MKMLRNIQVRLAAWEPRFSPSVYKAVLVALVAAAFAAPIGLVAVPYLEMFNDMAVQPKGKAQGLYGAAMGQAHIVDRLPVTGTLPMRYVPYPLVGQDEKTAQIAERTLTNPLRPTMPVLRRGQEVFHDYCRTCHGEAGEADGPIVGPDLFPAPPSLHTEAARKMKDGRIFHIITRGRNAMPSYADKLSAPERWSVIHFVRALQRSLQPKPEDLEP